jgi:hypothetical protein
LLSGEKVYSEALFMERSGLIKSETHYHVRWSSDSSIDWKPFPTEEEATQLAEQIKKPNDSYTIVERDDECERCKVFKSKAISQGSAQL